jgi:hypothetical protein
VHRFNSNLNELTFPRTDNYRSNLENMEYFSYMVNLITKDARCTQEITSRIAKEKVAFNKKKAIFTSKYE